MSSNTNIYLPIDVLDRDIRTAVAILLGAQARVDPLGLDGAVHCVVEKSDVKLTPSTVPGMAHLIGAGGLHGTLHYVARHGEGQSRVRSTFHTCLSGGDRPLWHEVGKALVRFFGGFVVLSDYKAAKGANVVRGKRRCPTDRHGQVPTDGEAWNRYHRALAKLKALPKACRGD